MLRLLHVLRFVGLVSLNWHALLLRGIDVRRTHADGRPRFRVYLNIAQPFYAKAAAILTPAAAPPPAVVASPRRRVVKRASPAPVLTALGVFVTSHVSARRGATPALLQVPQPPTTPRLPMRLAPPAAVGAAASRLPLLYQPARPAEPPPPRPAERRLPLLADCLPGTGWLVAVCCAALARALLSPCAAVAGEGASLTAGACACIALGGLASLGHPHAAMGVALLGGLTGALLSLTAPTIELLAPAHLVSTLGAGVLPLAQAWAVRRIRASAAETPDARAQRIIAIVAQLGCLCASHDLVLSVGGVMARQLLLGLRGSLSPDAKLRLLFTAACAAAAVAAAAGLTAQRGSVPLPPPTREGLEWIRPTIDTRAKPHAVRTPPSLGARLPPSNGRSWPQANRLASTASPAVTHRGLSRPDAAAQHTAYPPPEGPPFGPQLASQTQLGLRPAGRAANARPLSKPIAWPAWGVVVVAACIGATLASLELRLPTPALDLAPLFPAHRRLLPDIAARLAGPAALLLFLCCGTSLDALLWLAFALGVAASALCSFSAGVRGWFPASPLLAQLRALLLLASAHAAELAAVAGVAILSPDQACALSMCSLRAAWLLLPAAKLAAGGGRQGGAPLPLPLPPGPIGPIQPPGVRARGGRAAPVRPARRPARSAPPLRFTPEFTPVKATRPAAGAGSR